MQEKTTSKYLLFKPIQVWYQPFIEEYLITDIVGIQIKESYKDDCQLGEPASKQELTMLI